MFHMMTLAQTRGCFEDRPFLPDRGCILAAIAEIKVRTIAGTTTRCRSLVRIFRKWAIQNSVLAFGSAGFSQRS